MKNHQQEPMDEALLLRYLLGDINDSEFRIVEEWLQQDEGNRKILEKLESLWLETGKISPSPVAVDTDAAWEKVSRQIDREEKNMTGNKPYSVSRFNPFIRYVLATAAVALFLFGLYFLFIKKGSTGKETVINSGRRITPDTLRDGSVIILNKYSRLTIPGEFNEKKREVALSGEASCNIAHDPGRPFIIELERAKIRVLGTSFHVRAYPGQEIIVTVKEGTVLLFTLDRASGDTNGIRLERGMKGVLRNGSLIPERMRNNEESDIEGYEETLEYKTTPLRIVFKDLTRIFGTGIEVSDSSVYNCQLTATFSGEPVEDILRIIAATFDLQLQTIDGIYLFKGNGCKESSK